MQRRKRWMLVALVLLPSAIGITALSISRSTRAVPAPAATPAQQIPESDDRAPGIESAAPAAPTPASAPPRAPKPEVNSESEERPRIPEVMLADTIPPMSFELDSWRAEASYQSAGPSRHYTGSRWRPGAGYFAGGGGGGSGSRSTSQDGKQEQVETLTEGSGPNTDPVLPEDEEQGEGQGEESGLGPQDPQPGTPPLDDPLDDPLGPVTTQPDDWFDLIDDYTPDTDPKTPVSVPEPSTWGLFGLGLLGLWLGRRTTRSPMRS